jgi:putative peptide zinc metalloprotease protein
VTDTTQSERPRALADGVELIGEFKDSGYKKAPYIARRQDGQVVQLTELLYLVAEGLEEGGTYDDVAAYVGEAFGRSVSADNIRTLEGKLEPLGLLVNPDGSQPEVRKHEGFLQLNMRTGVVPPRVVRMITSIFRPLFLPPVIVAALLALVAFDIWFFFVQGVGESIRETLYSPATMLLVLGLVVLSAAFHESGHATGCRYGGADPGVMGAGIYLVWPVFYTNVTDSYRLSKGGRLRVDLGGVYFNVLFLLATAGVYFLTRFEPLLLVILVQHLEMLRQFMPFVRLDGYYVVSDATGVPDLFARMKPIMTSFLPGREPDERVTQLKPWVRVAVTSWVLSVIPILLFNVAIIVLNLPRIAATTWDSLLIQSDELQAALGSGDLLMAAYSGLQGLLLVLPLAGITYMAIRVGRQVGRRVWTGVKERPVARYSFASGTLAVAIVAAFVLWPNGDYRPLQPGERYRVQDLAASVRHIPTGRPSLTVEREEELGGAPWMRGGHSVAAEEAEPQEPGATATPSPTSTPTPSPTSTPTPTPSPTSTPTPTPSPTSTPTPTPSPTSTPTPTPSPSPTTSPSPSPTGEPSPTPSPSP